MRDWKLTTGNPLTLSLAADARLSATNYADDQIWELSFGGGEPPALAVQTTYGLRAHWMRMFPRFTRGEVSQNDPASFHQKPAILRFYPNSLTMTFAPFEGLEVLAEYRVIESNIIAGRIKITNLSILPQAFRFEWITLLNPIDRQGGMVAVPMGPITAMKGETAYLYLSVFMTGGPQAATGPYPGLALDMELYPGSWRQLTWASAAMRNQDAADEAARGATARPWEAEQARVEMLNRSQSVSIHTGNEDWDAVFALTQKAACELLMNNPPALPHTSFVLSRRPDRGFSLRGDGSDYPLLWNGQTALDAYFLGSLLPGAPELTAGIVRNFIAVQNENGSIDGKPGLGGQRNRKMAQPVLAALAAQIAPSMSQVEWFEEVFPPLLKFFDAWFAPQYDKDGDGFPEWETSLQSGVEDSPIFERWSLGARGIRADQLESPALAAMLLNECHSLITMAQTLIAAQQSNAAFARLSGTTETRSTELEDDLTRLREREEHLRTLLDSTWDASQKIYHYRDYQTHLSLPGELIMEFSGPGRITSRKRFSQPRRLVVHIQASEERSYPVVVILHGFTLEGETTETLGPRSFSWHGAQAHATTQNTFVALKRVELTGLGETDQVKVLSADTSQEDCSLFLPLWAQATDEEKARQLVEGPLLGRYFYPFGIPVFPPNLTSQAALPGLHTSASSALMTWNHLIGEGLLKYNYRAEAAELVTRLMNAVIPSLKNHQAFRQYYDVQTGLAAGERGHLHGLAPLGLFLKTIGIQSIQPNLISIQGFNPFSWTINVQYRNVQITCFADRTEVILKGDKPVIIDRLGLHHISLVRD